MRLFCPATAAALVNTFRLYWRWQSRAWLINLTPLAESVLENSLRTGRQVCAELCGGLNERRSRTEHNNTESSSQPSILIRLKTWTLRLDEGGGRRPDDASSQWFWSLLRYADETASSQGDSHWHGFTRFLQRGSLEMWFRSLGGNKHARCCCSLPVRQSNILSLLDRAIISTGLSWGTSAPPRLWTTPQQRPLPQSSHAQSQCPYHTDGEQQNREGFRGRRKTVLEDVKYWNKEV